MQNEIHSHALELKGIEYINHSNNQVTKNYRNINSPRSLAKKYLSKSILEQCLQSLDIFKEIIEDAVQKSKIIRDVIKNIKLQIYEVEDIIYNKGDLAESIYFVIFGEVSLCMPLVKQDQEKQDQESQLDGDIQKYNYQQIDVFEKGVGFGEAEFINKKKRSLVAKVKITNTVIGKINAQSFEQIIELYRQRVYFKKMDMFSKCPLLKVLQLNKLEFIVNNAKPISFNLSRQIIKQGQKPKFLYLITKGQVEINRKPEEYHQNKTYSKNKLTLDNENIQKIKIKTVVIGILQEGEFIGDCELALGSHFDFSIICKSQKVTAYCCDQRIILSQMNQEMLMQAAEYYQNKKVYYQNRLDCYKDTKKKIEGKFDHYHTIKLNKNQILMRKKIRNRYIEKIPSIIGQSSPRQIELMINRKEARIKTEATSKSQIINLPTLQLGQQKKKLKRNNLALSPLLKSRLSHQRNNAQAYEYQTLTPPKEHKAKEIRYKSYEMPQKDDEFIRCQTRPMLVFLQPYQNKLQSLHERLAQSMKLQNKKIKYTRQLNKQSIHNNMAISEINRIYQFLSKVKEHKSISNKAK